MKQKNIKTRIKYLKITIAALMFASIMLVASGCSLLDVIQPSNKVTDINELTAEVGELPIYNQEDGKTYCTINGNKSNFNDELTQRAKEESFEEYGALDSHGRCTGATACVSHETMPARYEERGDISEIHPSGWKSGMGWERCHLIAWSLSAENANERNLITGTHMMNAEGMLPFEESIARYIDDTDNHVLYQVTPIYEGKNLIASGVHMMAWSVEDNGRGINFNIYCYNANPNKEIDYKTGAVTDVDSKGKEVVQKSRKYIINTNSGKFHYPSCNGVSDISEHNRKEIVATRNALINEGYEPCGLCEP